MNRIRSAFVPFVLLSALFTSPAWAQNAPPEAQPNGGFEEQYSTEFDAPFQLDVSSFFTDPDGDPLTYHIAEGAMEVTWTTYQGDSYFATDQVCLKD